MLATTVTPPGGECHVKKYIFKGKLFSLIYGISLKNQDLTLHIFFFKAKLSSAET